MAKYEDEPTSAIRLHVVSGLVMHALRVHLSQTQHNLCNVSALYLTTQTALSEQNCSGKALKIVSIVEHTMGPVHGPLVQDAVSIVSGWNG